MGAFLEKPITEKATDKGEGEGLRYAVSAMQGWRKEMEDKHVAQTVVKNLKNHSFFGVFDGHAGASASLYCSEHLLDSIITAWPTPNQVQDHKLIEKAFREGFLNLDNEMRKVVVGEYRGGTTAITVMITPDKIIFGNCGDSRGLLCRDGSLKFETADHKPSNEGERRRIEAAGGSVMMQRVNGSLAVSRALGDFEFKMVPDKAQHEQLVSPEPEVTIIDRDHEKDHYLFLACDGVYDVMTNEQVVKYINRKLRIEKELVKVCSDLIDTCLHKNSRDNMSAILITFKAAPTPDDQAIKEAAELRKRAQAHIEEKIKELVNEASDPLELEENEVMSRLPDMLATELPEFDFAEERPFISEKLALEKKEKFGEHSFDGPSDSALAPDFFTHNVGGTPVMIVPETEAMEVHSESHPEDEIPLNHPSPVQTDSSQSA